MELLNNYNKMELLNDYINIINDIIKLYKSKNELSSFLNTDYYKNINDKLTNYGINLSYIIDEYNRNNNFNINNYIKKINIKIFNSYYNRIIIYKYLLTIKYDLNFIYKNLFYLIINNFNNIKIIIELLNKIYNKNDNNDNIYNFTLLIDLTKQTNYDNIINIIITIKNNKKIYINFLINKLYTIYDYKLNKNDLNTYNIIDKINFDNYNFDNYNYDKFYLNYIYNLTEELKDKDLDYMANIIINIDNIRYHIKYLEDNITVIDKKNIIIKLLEINDINLLNIHNKYKNSYNIFNEKIIQIKNKINEYNKTNHIISYNRSEYIKIIKYNLRDIIALLLILDGYFYFDIDNINFKLPLHVILNNKNNNIIQMYNNSGLEKNKILNEYFNINKVNIKLFITSNYEYGPINEALILKNSLKDDDIKDITYNILKIKYYHLFKHRDIVKKNINNIITNSDNIITNSDNINKIFNILDKSDDIDNISIDTLLSLNSILTALKLNGDKSDYMNEYIKLFIDKK